LGGSGFLSSTLTTGATLASSFFSSALGATGAGMAI
jgi:hypothetical protein